jgi:glutathione S-transferase
MARRGAEFDRPWIMNVALIDLFYQNEEWAKLRRPGAVEFAQKRLSALAKSLGDKPYLDGDRFTAGDLMMTTVLRKATNAWLPTSNAALRGRPSSTRSMPNSAISGRCIAPPAGSIGRQ